MGGVGELLDGNAMLELLAKLGARLEAKGIAAEIYVVGGAALAMAYDARRSSSDIDAVIRPADEVLEEARSMAAETQGLSDDWLNDAVAKVMPSQPDHAPRELIVTGSLAIMVASPEYLLGMKCTTGRMSQQDKADASFLCRLLAIEDVETLVTVIHTHCPSPLSLEPRRWFLEEVVRGAKSHAPPHQGSLQTVTPSTTGTCTFWLPRARRVCTLPTGHRGQHR